MVATRRRRRRRRRKNKPKVRNLRRFWYLETSWIMPDMHPMLLAWRVSAATFSLYEDDDTKVSCLFIDPQPLSLSLSLSLCVSVFMSKNCFGEMWKRAREVYLWLWGVAKQLAIDNGSKFINCFSFSFDNKFIIGYLEERKKERKKMVVTVMFVWFLNVKAKHVEFFWKSFRSWSTPTFLCFLFQLISFVLLCICYTIDPIILFVLGEFLLQFNHGIQVFSVSDSLY